MILVGTAGHIDHGKSALVEALTGSNPMHLPEEKAREMTIDLGFAHLPHPDGYVLGIVDVPGHEKLIRTMVAGATGFRLALWVVDAREGLMPQSTEHLHVLDLLGVPKVVPVITKADAATESEIQRVTNAVEARLRSTSLSSCFPQIVDSVSKRGIAALRETLFTTCRDLVPQKAQFEGLVYMPIDRSFVVKGVGTVVTGTLIRGQLKRGDTVAISSASEPCRIRSLHNHFTSVESITAGHRVGVQLHGIRAADIRRGDILVNSDYPYRSRRLNVELRFLDRTPFHCKPGIRVLFHAASFEMEGRLFGLVRAADRTLAQIHLPTESCFYPHQRFILRATNPAVTVGGGTILDLAPDRPRRITEAERAAYETGDNLQARLVGYLEESNAALFDASLFQKKWMTNALELVSAAERESDLRTAHGNIDGHDAHLLWHKKRDVLAMSRLREWMKDAAGQKEEIPYAAAAKGLKIQGTHVKMYLAYLRDAEASVTSELKQNCRLTANALVFHPGRDGLSDREELLAADLLLRLKSDDIQPARTKEYRTALSTEAKTFDKVVSLLIRDGRAIRISNDFILHAAACRRLEDSVAGFPADRFTASEFGKQLGLSRKHSVPYLEYLGRRGITRREGDHHVLVLRTSAVVSTAKKR